MTPLAPPPLVFPCRGCGAALAPAEGEAYTTCTHCGTTGFVDLSGVLQTFRAEPRISERELPRLLRTQGLVDIVRAELAYHPFWEFGWRGRVLAIDATPDEAPELDPLKLPTGVRRRWDGEAGAGAPARRPTVVPEAAAAVASARLRGVVEGGAATLVHHPVYRVIMRTGEVVWVEAVEGRVLAGGSEDGAEQRRGEGELGFLVVGGAAAAIALPLPTAAGVALLLAMAPSLLRLAGR